MEWQQLVWPILLTLIEVASVPVLAYAVKKLLEWLNAKVKNEKLNAALDNIVEFAHIVVLQKKQVLVDEAKKALEDGKIDEVEYKSLQDTAKQEAVNALKEVGAKSLAEVQKLLGLSDAATETLVDGVVEATVANSGG